MWQRVCKRKLVVIEIVLSGQPCWDNYSCWLHCCRLWWTILSWVSLLLLLSCTQSFLGSAFLEIPVGISVFGFSLRVFCCCYFVHVSSHFWSWLQLIKKLVSEKNMSAWQHHAVIKDRTATPTEFCRRNVRACLILRINSLGFFWEYCIFLFKNSNEWRELHATFRMTMNTPGCLSFAWPLLPPALMQTLRERCTVVPSSFAHVLPTSHCCHQYLSPLPSPNPHVFFLNYLSSWVLTD